MRPTCIPFAYGLIYTRPEICKEKRDLCARMARAYAGAAKIIQEKPDEVFETSSRSASPRWTRSCWPPPGRWRRRRTPRTSGSRVPQLENSQKISLERQAARAQGRAEELRGAVHRRVRALRWAVHARAHLLAAALLFALIVSMAATLPAAQAQNYPNGPVKIIVGVGAGSSADVILRVVADHLAAPLGTAGGRARSTRRGRRARDPCRRISTAWMPPRSLYCARLELRRAAGADAGEACRSTSRATSCRSAISASTRW